MNALSPSIAMDPTLDTNLDAGGSRGRLAAPPAHHLERI
jgi:hypothetical protein